MQRTPIDLRSDTVTKPTPGMRRAMAEAEVGDDVFGDDPTVKRLEARTAELLGKEAAVFVPSGTMANQIGIGVTHSRATSCSAPARHTFTSGKREASPDCGAQRRGPLRAMGACSHSTTCATPFGPRHNAHYVRTRLVCLENTHNRAGGRIHPMTSIAEIARSAREHSLAMHLDGAH